MESELLSLLNNSRLEPWVPTTNISTICWEYMCANPCDKAVELVMAVSEVYRAHKIFYPTILHISALCQNPSDIAVNYVIDLCTKLKTKINDTLDVDIDLIKTCYKSKNELEHALEQINCWKKQSEPEQPICWERINQNTNSRLIQYLIDEWPEKIVWRYLCKNPCDAAADYIKYNMETGKLMQNVGKEYENCSEKHEGEKLQKLVWSWLCANPHEKIVQLIIDEYQRQQRLENPLRHKIQEMIRTGKIKEKPKNKIEAIRNRVEPCKEELELAAIVNSCRLNYSVLSGNQNNRIIVEILSHNVDKIDWVGMSSNSCSSAVALIARYQQNIYWGWLSYNQHPVARQLLFQNMDKINLRAFSKTFLKEDIINFEEHLDWYMAAANPAIFNCV